MSAEVEDIVATGMANALHATGVEAVVLLSLKDGRVTRRFYGDPDTAARVAVRYAASVLSASAEKLMADTEDFLPLPHQNGDATEKAEQP